MSSNDFEVDEGSDGVGDPVLRRIRAFETIRDIRYVLRDSSYRMNADGAVTSEHLVAQDCGGCSDKARSLRSALLDSCEFRYGVVEFYWKDTLEKFSIRTPESLFRQAGRLLFCFHTFVFARINDNWILIDPTWDAALRKSGFPVNMGWDGQRETKLAVSPTSDIIQFANEKDLISYTSSRYEQRRRSGGDSRDVQLRAFDEFVFSMNQWLEEVRSAYKAEENRSARSPGNDTLGGRSGPKD